ncbi:hypothetical protein HHS_04510 [Candidatus Pantoea carbekii]|uniref:Uncharacterized protein n=1 Tax=Candidatus Pantoea carbekii TaxID=1235990 RepID=U3U2Q3_9GAMM|nr:hypothetical protein HHS_04510 [Candidatus Pantoea carbekii]
MIIYYEKQFSAIQIIDGYGNTCKYKFICAILTLFIFSKVHAYIMCMMSIFISNNYLYKKT